MSFTVRPGQRGNGFVDPRRRYRKTAHGDSSETRFASTLFGSGTALKQEAVSMLN